MQTLVTHVASAPTPATHAIASSSAITALVPNPPGTQSMSAHGTSAKVAVGRIENPASVGTGSLILGAAGLLDGYRAGCHWAQRDMLTLFNAIPIDARTVVDRNRVTGGGVTAGIDFALTLTAMIRGEAHARAVQLALEYDPAPPFDSGSPGRAGPELVATYQRRVQSLVPTRDDDLRALAKRRGYR